VLQSQARYGEKLEAVDSLIAIACSVIMNLVHPQIYLTEWKAVSIRASGQILSGGRAVAGLILLGFTSVYREGFETVQFLASPGAHSRNKNINVVLVG
jgi:high-affinity iron transporter